MPGSEQGREHGEQHGGAEQGGDDHMAPLFGQIRPCVGGGGVGIQPLSGIAGLTQRAQQRVLVGALQHPHPGLLAGQVDLGFEHARYLVQRSLGTANAAGAGQVVQLDLSGLLLGRVAGLLQCLLYGQQLAVVLHIHSGGLRRQVNCDLLDAVYACKGPLNPADASGAAHTTQLQCNLRHDLLLRY